MNSSRRCRAALVVVIVATLAACSSHTTPAPAATTSPSPSPSGNPYGVGYAAYGEPLGAPVPDLIKDGFTHVTKLSPHTARIVGPAYGLTLSETATTTTISAAQQTAIGLVGDSVSAPPMKAPPGIEFVVVQIGPPADYTQTGNPEDVTWSIQVGPHAVPIPKHFGGPVRDFEEGSSIVVSAPIASDATLSATDDGKTQSISLRTGKAAGGVSSASLRSGESTFFTLVQLSGPGINLPALAGVPDNGYATLFTVHASLALGADGHPAAAAGRAWLVLQADVTSDVPDVTVAQQFSVSLPLRRSLAVRVNGTAIPIPEVTVASGAYLPSGPVTWVVDVPRSLTTIQVTYTFNGTIEQWTAPTSVTDSATSNKVDFRVVRGRTQSATLHLS